MLEMTIVLTLEDKKGVDYYLYSFFNSVRRTRIFGGVQVCQKE